MERWGDARRRRPRLGRVFEPSGRGDRHGSARRRDKSWFDRTKYQYHERGRVRKFTLRPTTSCRWPGGGGKATAPLRRNECTSASNARRALERWSGSLKTMIAPNQRSNRRRFHRGKRRVKMRRYRWLSCRGEKSASGRPNTTSSRHRRPESSDSERDGRRRRKSTFVRASKSLVPVRGR